MPRLLLLRHAKAASAEKGGGGDHERALSERGRNDAAEMGRVMAARGETVGLVLCSTSRRTRETWELVQPALRGAPKVRFLRGIYSSEETYIDILRAEGDGADAVLLIGHNPTIQSTALTLAADDGGASGGFPPHFPTAALAILSFDGSWAELQPGTGKPLAFLVPESAESG
jgi:phosphohistidine phosphatase